MIPSLGNLRKDLESLERQLRRIRAQHVNRSAEKEAVRELVKRYFREYQVDVASELGEERLKDLDQEMQDLLRCAQRRTETKQYVRLVRACLRELDDLEREAVVRRHDDFALDRREQLILETLNRSSAGATRQEPHRAWDRGKSW